jgi:hypothetical protein
MKLINTHIIIFIVVFLLTIAITSFFYFVAPENPPKVNINPLPNLDPGYITNSNPQDKSSCQSLLACDPSNDTCDKCGNDYKCITVSSDPASKDFYGNMFFNGIKVTDGNWCLPDIRLPEGTICNKFVDKYVWGDYEGVQKWDCIREYPQFFIDGKYLACKDFSTKGKNETLFDFLNRMKDNKLLRKSDGKVFDPFSSTFYSDWGGNVPSLYEKDKDGKNVFGCSCNLIQTEPDIANNVPSMVASTISLPEDPFNCHINPCYQYGEVFQGSEPNTYVNAWDSAQLKCNCDVYNKAVSKDGTDIFVQSNVTGTCFDANTECNTVLGWDTQNNRCKCDNKSISEICNSSTYSRPGVKNCEQEHKLGSYCYDICSSNNNPCNGGICNVVNNEVVCTCPTPDPNIKPATKCNEVDANPYSKTGGKYCNEKCLVTGSQCSFKNGISGQTQTCNGGCGICCSGKTRSEKNPLGDITTYCD